VIRRPAGSTCEAGIVFGFWSGARDLNPGPHGPEIHAISSTESDFERFEFISTRQLAVSRQFQPPSPSELLHELLHETASEVGSVMQFSGDSVELIVP